MRSQRRILQEENEQSTDGCVTAVRENFSSDTMSEPESELDSTHIVQDTYFDESKSHSDPTSPLVLFRTYDSNIQLELVSDYLYNHRGEHIKIKSRKTIANREKIFLVLIEKIGAFERIEKCRFN
jgi:hypothetical protein